MTHNPDLSNSSSAQARINRGATPHGMEEFTGPSAPGEFTLFVMPPPVQKYRDQLLAQVEALRAGVESGEIQELAYVALSHGDWTSHFTGSDSRLRMAGAIMDLAMERLGYQKG